MQSRLYVITPAPQFVLHGLSSHQAVQTAIVPLSKQATVLVSRPSQLLPHDPTEHERLDVMTPAPQLALHGLSSHQTVQKAAVPLSEQPVVLVSVPTQPPPHEPGVQERLLVITPFPHRASHGLSSHQFVQTPAVPVSEQLSVLLEEPSQALPHEPNVQDRL